MPNPSTLARESEPESAALPSLDAIREANAAVAAGLLTAAEARRLLGLPALEEFGPIETFQAHDDGAEPLRFAMDRPNFDFAELD